MSNVRNPYERPEMEMMRPDLDNSARVKELEAQLERIKRVADTGTAKAFLQLNDEAKREWFALSVDESSRRKKAEEALEEAKLLLRNAVQECGHHISLQIRSVESDYQFCELCDCRKQRNDALIMEKWLKEELKAEQTKRQEMEKRLMELLINAYLEGSALRPGPSRLYSDAEKYVDEIMKGEEINRMLTVNCLSN